MEHDLLMIIYYLLYNLLHKIRYNRSTAWYTLNTQCPKAGQVMRLLLSVLLSLQGTALSQNSHFDVEV
jgi:hypothetical protein